MTVTGTTTNTKTMIAYPIVLIWMITQDHRRTRKEILVKIEDVIVKSATIMMMIMVAYPIVQVNDLKERNPDIMVKKDAFVITVIIVMTTLLDITTSII